MRSVLQDKNCSGPETLYWVFNGVDPKGVWENITVTAPGKTGEEYPKTYGHYHGVDVVETYKLVAGHAIFVMQAKFIENGIWIPEKVSAVYLIKAIPGDEITITPELGHSWSNVGDSAMVTFDDWRSGHQPSDYEPITKLKGMAYYLTEENGQVKPVVNPNYKDVPEPIWLTAEEFKSRQKDG